MPAQVTAAGRDQPYRQLDVAEATQGRREAGAVAR